VSDSNEAPLARPAARRALVWAFTALALQGVGGVLAIVQRDLVERKRWMTREQFVDDWAVAQILPGANVINLSLMIGDRYFGWTGAAAAVAGMLSAPLLVLLLVVVLYSTVAQTELAQGALRGMGAVAAGLIIATGMKLIGALKQNPMGMGMCSGLAALSFVAVAWLRWPLIWVLLGLGGAACLWSYRLLSKTQGRVQ
jgi:chromate transporter